MTTEEGKPESQPAPTKLEAEDHPLAYFYIGGGKIIGDIISPVVPLEDYDALK